MAALSRITFQNLPLSGYTTTSSTLRTMFHVSNLLFNLLSILIQFGWLYPLERLEVLSEAAIINKTEPLKKLLFNAHVY